MGTRRAGQQGPSAYAIAALEMLNRLAGESIGTVKVLLDGQEEPGSGGLLKAMPGWARMLKADILLVVDTGMAPSGAPAIVMGLRGILHMTVTVDGPEHDLHSGTHGGLAPQSGPPRCVASSRACTGRTAR